MKRAPDHRDASEAMRTLRPVYGALAEGYYPLAPAERVHEAAVRNACNHAFGVTPGTLTTISLSALRQPVTEIMLGENGTVVGTLDPERETGVPTSEMLGRRFGGLTRALRHKIVGPFASLHAEFVPVLDGQFTDLLKGTLCASTDDAIGSSVVLTLYYYLASILLDDRLGIELLRPLASLVTSSCVPLGIRKNTREELLLIVA